MYLHGRPDSPNGIVLMGAGDTENGHCRVADKLFNKAVVLLNHLSDLPEDPVHNLSDLLRVKPFGHGRIAGQI